MILYERILFLIVTGTLGLFVIAFLLGFTGIILALVPELEVAVRARLAEIRTQSVVIFEDVYQRSRAAFRTFLDSRQSLRRSA
jgi:uncharacterized iron-regulated membrane protein